jgi:hypothetical protein
MAEEWSEFLDSTRNFFWRVRISAGAQVNFLVGAGQRDITGQGGLRVGVISGMILVAGRAGTP